MAYVMRTSKKCQVVIPRRVRTAVGLRPGQAVTVEVEDGRIVIRPVPDDPIAYLTGRYAGGPSILEELMEEHRREVAELDEMGS